MSITAIYANKFNLSNKNISCIIYELNMMIAKSCNQVKILINTQSNLESKLTYLYIFLIELQLCSPIFVVVSYFCLIR